jgi:hypothetical protein
MKDRRRPALHRHIQSMPNYLRGALAFWFVEIKKAGKKPA